MDKKRERQTLDDVYGWASFLSVEDSEKPDFLLHHHREGYSFGVEVTAVYPSPAHARLINIEGYDREIWTEGRYRPGDEKDLLRVTLHRIADDGTRTDDAIRGVLPVKYPDPYRYAKIAECIREKNSKFSGYRSGLGHTSLIIHDHFQVDATATDPYATSLLLSQGVRAALLESPFREVYLVNTDRHGTRYFRPLRMVYLLEQFAILRDLLSRLWAPLDITPDTFTPILIAVLSRVGIDIAFSDDGDASWAVYGGNAATMLPDGGISLRWLAYSDPTTKGLPRVSLELDRINQLAGAYLLHARTPPPIRTAIHMQCAQGRLRSVDAR